MGLGCPPLGNPPQQEQGGLCLGLPHAGEGVMGSSLIVRHLSVLNLALVLNKVWPLGAVRALAMLMQMGMFTLFSP